MHVAVIALARTYNCTVRLFSCTVRLFRRGRGVGPTPRAELQFSIFFRRCTLSFFQNKFSLNIVCLPMAQSSSTNKNEPKITFLSASTARRSTQSPQLLILYHACCSSNTSSYQSSNKEPTSEAAHGTEFATSFLFHRRPLFCPPPLLLLAAGLFGFGFGFPFTLTFTFMF